MSYINGSFSVGGYPQDGATANLYLSTAFTSPPSGGNLSSTGTALPAASAIVATTTTGPQHGSNGAYRFTVSTSGAWWVGISWNGYNEWFFHSLPGGAALTVKDYGAVGAGTNVDDTAAFNAAIAAAVAVGGGNVLVPPGKYAVNLTLLNDNVSLIGTSHTLSTSTTNCLVPFATGSPVIQIGVDINRISNGLLRDLTISGGGPNGIGKTGLYLLSPQRWNFDNVYVNGFSQNCLLVQGGFTQPAELCWFEQCQFQARSNCTDASVTVAYPVSGSQWTTTIYFTDCQIYSPGVGIPALKVDGTQIYAVNTFVNANASGGVKFALTNPAAPGPSIFCTNFQVDTGNSSDVILQTHTSSLYIGSFLNGLFDISGRIQNNAGATTAANVAAGAVGDRMFLSSPYVIDHISFGSSTQPYNSQHVISAATNMFMTSSGDIFIEHGLGKAIKVLDSVNGLPGTIQAGVFDYRNTGLTMISGTGSPESTTGAVTGSIYLQADNDPGRLLWVKATGGGSTGWRPVTEHVPLRVFASTSGAVAVDDQVVVCNGCTVVTLPTGSSTGRLVTVKDGAGTAAGGNIKVRGGTSTIDGNTTYTIAANYGHVTVAWNGTEWSVIEA